MLQNWNSSSAVLKKKPVHSTSASAESADDWSRASGIVNVGDVTPGRSFTCNYIID
jgi:hypothetical protein